MKPRVIIIGAGFAGRGVAEQLVHLRLCEVLLVEKNDHLSYKPLYPDVAAGRLNHAVITYPLAAYARYHHIPVLHGTWTGIDMKAKTVTIDGRAERYEYVVIATGAESAWYGNDQYKKYTYSFDSGEECLRLQRHIEGWFQSSHEKKVLTIIGGGYTGIEFASHVARRRNMSRAAIDIIILEQAHDIVTMLPEGSREKIRMYCEKEGIQIRTTVRVKNIAAHRVETDHGTIHTDCTVWTAGMTGRSELSALGCSCERGRVCVDATLRPEGETSVFVIGDAAHRCRMAVPFAKQHAAYVSKAIIQSIKGEKIMPIREKDYGFVIALAGRKGIGRIMGISFKGFMGYVFHYLMCALTLPGVKNKFLLMRSLWRK